jgi:hypothetical protein
MRAHKTWTAARHVQGQGLHSTLASCSTAAQQHSSAGRHRSTAAQAATAAQQHRPPTQRSNPGRPRSAHPVVLLDEHLALGGVYGGAQQQQHLALARGQRTQRGGLCVRRVVGRRLQQSGSTSGGTRGALCARAPLQPSTDARQAPRARLLVLAEQVWVHEYRYDLHARAVSAAGGTQASVLARTMHRARE